jgi:hypothetical protein
MRYKSFHVEYPIIALINYGIMEDVSVLFAEITSRLRNHITHESSSKVICVMRTS